MNQLIKSTIFSLTVLLTCFVSLAQDYESYVDDDYRTFNESPDVKYKTKNVTRNKRTYKVYIPKGKATYYYEDGVTLYVTGKWSNGLETGIWTFYTENKHTLSGELKKGEPYGEWLLKDHNGTIKSSVTYNEHGEPISGTGLAFYDDNYSQIKQETKYLENGKYSFVKEYYENGNLKFEVKKNVEEDEDLGDRKNYYENGQLESITNYKEIRDYGGFSDYSYKRNGTWKYYTENGILEKQIVYKLDSDNDSYKDSEILFYKNGNKKLELNNRGEIAKVYDEAGNKAKVLFYDKDWDRVNTESDDAEYFRIYNPSKNGSKQKIRDYFLKSRRIQFEGFFTNIDERDSRKDVAAEGPVAYYLDKDKEGMPVVSSKGFKDRSGKSTGEWMGYYEDNDELKYKGSFFKGERIGEWEYFTQNGILKEKINYNGAVPIGESFYNKLKIWNKCDENIHFYLKYKNLEGEWISAGYNIEPGKEAYLIDTFKSVVYFHAKTDSGKVWKGPETIEIYGETYKARRLEIGGDNYGFQTRSITCKN